MGLIIMFVSNGEFSVKIKDQKTLVIEFKSHKNL